MNTSKTCSVHIVTWNGSAYIAPLMKSLEQQTYTNIQIYFLDNGSTDTTVEEIKKSIKNTTVECTLVQEPKNLGFAKAHNKLIKSSTHAYCLLVNQDMELMPECIETMMKEMQDTTKNYAAVGARIMQLDKTKKEQYTATIDSLGLQVLRSRQVVDLMQHQSWDRVKSTFSQSVIPVFGISGALPLYKKSALEEISFSDGTYFDESYGSYKEDVDLAFRLQSAGYESAAALSAVAYHVRSVTSEEKSDIEQQSKNKQTQSKRVRLQSYTNHLATVFKNEYAINTLRDILWIVWYELKKFTWYLLFDKAVLLAVFRMPWHEYSKKRIAISQKRKKTAKQIRVWWI